MAISDYAVEVRAQGWRTLAALHGLIEESLEKSLQAGFELSVVEYTVLDTLDRQWQQMQLAAIESETLRAASPVTPAQANEALRAATERLGSKAKLLIQGDRATITFTGLAFEDLRAWVGEARSGARARPVEAQLLKAASGYSGSISVVLASAA